MENSTTAFIIGAVVVIVAMVSVKLAMIYMNGGIGEFIKIFNHLCPWAIKTISGTATTICSIGYDIVAGISESLIGTIGSLISIVQDIGVKIIDVGLKICIEPIKAIANIDKDVIRSIKSTYDCFSATKTAIGMSRDMAKVLPMPDMVYELKPDIGGTSKALDGTFNAFKEGCKASEKIVSLAGKGAVLAAKGLPYALAASIGSKVLMSSSGRTVFKTFFEYIRARVAPIQAGYAILSSFFDGPIGDPLPMATIAIDLITKNISDFTGVMESGLHQAIENIFNGDACSLFQPYAVAIFFPAWRWVKSIFGPFEWMFDWIEEEFLDSLMPTLCHDSSCIIFTRRGEIPLSNLEIGDEVATHKATYEKVIRIVKTESNGVFLMDGTTQGHPRVLKSGRIVSYSGSSKLACIDSDKDISSSPDIVELRDASLISIELEGPCGTYFIKYKEGKPILYKDLKPNFDSTPTASILLYFMVKRFNDSFLETLRKPFDEQEKDLDELSTSMKDMLRGFMQGVNEITLEEKININTIYMGIKSNLFLCLNFKNCQNEKEFDKLGMIYYSLYTSLKIYEDKIPYIYISSLIDFL